ncbi:MAG: type II toxin-antitoxin system Phd/YefM family antitoxin [Verrucomicrobiota bacterium]|nr:type II toxin-antitoxin system Phd/YefM family antitoxin [Verrucomicrobiota bacterium]
MKTILSEPEIITRKGKPVSVILPINMYQELIERAEDAEDMAWLRQARQKPMRYRSLNEYLGEKKSKARV